MLSVSESEQKYENKCNINDIRMYPIRLHKRARALFMEINKKTLIPDLHLVCLVGEQDRID
jgi:hypothetical protein